MPARTTRRTPATRRPTANEAPTEAQEVQQPGTTGKYLVLLREDAVSEGMRAMSEVAGLRVARSRDFKEGVAGLGAAGGADALVLDDIAVAVVDSPPDQIRSLGAAAAGEGAILAVEPERVVYPIDAMPSADYLRGYRDGVNQLVDKVLAPGGPTPEEAEAGVMAMWDESALTWGLQATRAAVSNSSGKGIRVAVLDTGMDLGHPDFAGRTVVSQSFIPGQAVQDLHGHGTHCIGTSCGSRSPGRLPRYGIAYEAEIYAGKVLSNQGSGSDGGILAGINWAIANQCTVVSMSLGAPTMPGDKPSPVYEATALRALRRGTLIIAAAGNESQRPFLIKPVSHPANCPSIMAVAALDPNLQVAFFSCGGINPGGGEVNIAAPGVAVISSWPRPVLYNKISGTSMATPHVSGIAALYAQANPGVRGTGLWSLLLSRARALPLPARDVGRGLAIAP